MPKPPLPRKRAKPKAPKPPPRATAESAARVPDTAAESHAEAALPGIDTAPNGGTNPDPKAMARSRAAKSKTASQAPKPLVADREPTQPLVVAPAQTPPALTPETLSAVEQSINRTFKVPALLAQALTHASVTDSRLASNERMEFLGDSVLGLVISERIYQCYPNLLEGEMTKLKSTAVSRQTCAVIARSLGLHKHLVLGKGMQNHHELPLSLEAAVLESVIAAIYLDAGYAAAEAFITPLIDPYILRAAADGHQENFKSVLQHHAQQQSLPPPSYRVLDEKGPDHAKAFKVAVDLGGRRFTPAWGQTKKKSEQLAALNALQELGLVQARDDGHLLVVGE